MFDTLRFADRLTSSGFESGQAEGMARALGDEFGRQFEHVTTKPDFDAAIGGVRSDVTALDAKFGALSAKFDALSAKVDGLSTQIKFILAILIVLMALGLVDTVPGMLG